MIPPTMITIIDGIGMLLSLEYCIYYEIAWTQSSAFILSSWMCYGLLTTIPKLFAANFIDCSSW